MTKQLHSPTNHMAKFLMGWVEWCALPGLNIPAIKVKVDTGAKTSVLHAEEIKIYRKNRQEFVKFHILPLQNNHEVRIQTHALVVDQRIVTSSNGTREERVVIRTPVMLADHAWDIEVTLTNRQILSYRMLLSREAVQGKVIIDPERKLCLGRISKATLRKLYPELKQKS
jgi:ribosomal protein S6--L-glutamate ligase